MRYNFDEPVDRRGTGSIKYDSPLGCEAMPEGVSQLWIADMDFETPAPILRAIGGMAAGSVLGYTSLSCMPGYYRALCDYYRKRFGWYINSRDVLITPGVVPALHMLVRALTRRGDGVIVQRPVYYPFFSAVADNERRIINNPLQRDRAGRYTMDFDDLRRKAENKNTTMMILCSPHNPVGRDWSEDELREVYSICHENGVLLVSDEIHCDLTRSEVRHTVMQSLFPEAQDIITCTAPSKTFNAAGLGRSHIIVRSSEIKEKLKPFVTDLTDPVTAAAVTAAFTECGEWLSQAKEYIDHNLEFLVSALKKRLPKAQMMLPEATYLAWINVSKYTKDSEALQKNLLLHESVYVEEGDRFGKEGEGFIRVNAACPARELSRLVDALCSRLDRLSFGAPMPDLSLPCAWGGGKLRLLSDNKKKLLVYLPTVISPFSQLYLAKLTSAEREFSAAGIKVFIATEDTVSALENRLNRKAIPYYLLSDSDGAAREKLKVKLAPYERYLVDENDIPALEVIAESGVKSPDGPVSLVRPAVFGIDTIGKVIIAHYADTLSDLPEPGELAGAFMRGGIR